MERLQTTDQEKLLIKTVGDICKDILLSNSPLASAYQKHKAERDSMEKGGKK